MTIQEFLQKAQEIAEKYQFDKNFVRISAEASSTFLPITKHHLEYRVLYEKSLSFVYSNREETPSAALESFYDQCMIKRKQYKKTEEFLNI